MEGIPKEKRKCLLCNQMEDEKHALVDCPAYGLIRDEMEEPTVKLPFLLALIAKEAFIYVLKLRAFLEPRFYFLQ